MDIDRYRHAQLGFPTKCIFCGGTPLTAEDYWPKWLQRRIPSSYKASSHTMTIFDPSTKKILDQTINISRKKSPLHHPLEITCGTCNNEWMSAIQNIASRKMYPLLSKWHDSTVISATHIIPVWATMFSMVYDYAHMPTQNITQAERDHFYATKNPLDNWIISICPIEAASLHGRVFKRTISRGGIQSTTSAARHLLIHVLSNMSYTRITPDMVAQYLKLRAVWPTPNRHLHSPRVIKSMQDFDSVATGITHLAERGEHRPPRYYFNS